MRSFGELVSDIHDMLSNEGSSINGYRFEKWVVKNTSLQIASYKGEEQKVLLEGDWILREWRSDKSVVYSSVVYSEDRPKVAIPISSLAPDLMLEATKDLYGKDGWRKGDVIFVECKWRSSGKFSLEDRQKRNYEFAVKRHFTKMKKKPLEHLFYVFGYGWNETKNEPMDAVCIPATRLYEKLPLSYINNFSIDDLKYWGVSINNGNILYDRPQK